MTANTIISNLVYPQDTSIVIQKTTFLNSKGFHLIAMNYHIDLAPFLNKHLRITNFGNISNEHAATTMTANVLYGTNTLNWVQGVGFNIDIPDHMEAEISGNYAHTSTRYSLATSVSSFSSANWTLNNKHYWFHKWIITYTLSQYLSSGANGNLISNPVVLTAFLEREFFRQNQARVTLSVYDLFNGNNGITQSTSATAVSQTRTVLLGRYFILSFIWKWEKF